MLLNEMFRESPPGYQDVTQDNSQTRLGDLRKTRLTLAQIRQLRQMNDLRVSEYDSKLVELKKQYGAVAPESSGF